MWRRHGKEFADSVLGTARSKSEQRVTIGGETSIRGRSNVDAY
jgi:hypothetical protein